MSLSIIIITKNEAERIDACLQSVAWADEIIVLDSGSTDNTVEKCQQYTDKIFITDWPGFGPQKNRALEKASGDWVFSIDADEHMTPLLADEIRRVITANAYDAYVVPRLSSYCGKTLKHGDWRNDHCLRLFRRGRAHFSNDSVHEKLLLNPDARTAQLKNSLHHQTFTSLQQMLEKMNSYSSLSASAKYAAGKRASLATAIGHGLWTFLRGYVLKGGFLDGREGFMLAVSNAEGTYYRYLKMVYDSDREISRA